ncbi:hypothetical protein AMS62_08685 [Bacillus sp. FJAT-18019]|nr:hypothetical protein AMS62_08685 [Bacillus sp. FJAT-18019]
MKMDLVWATKEWQSAKAPAKSEGACGQQPSEYAPNHAPYTQGIFQVYKIRCLLFRSFGMGDFCVL